MSLTNSLIIGGPLIGCLIGYAITSMYYNRRQRKLDKRITDMHRVIEALLDQINKLARKPINLDGDQNAYRQIRKQV